MRKLPKLRDVYRGVRKPAAPPTRVESDRRGKMINKEDEKEIKRHVGQRKGLEERDR